MKIINIKFENIERISINNISTVFHEQGITCEIGNKNIIRLYECLKYNIERKGIDFENYCKKIMKGKDDE